MELDGAFFCLFLCPMTLDSRNMWLSVGNSLSLNGKEEGVQPDSCIPIPAQKSIGGDSRSAVGVRKGAQYLWKLVMHYNPQLHNPIWNSLVLFYLNVLI